MRSGIRAACYLVAMVVCSGCWGATRLIYVNPETGRPVRVYHLAPNRMRIDSFKNAKMTKSLIYKRATDTVILLKKPERKYSVFDPAARKKIRSQVQKAVKEVETSTVARWMVKAVVGDKWQLLTSKPVVRGTGKQLVVGGRHCHRYHLSVGTIISRDLCVVPPGALDISAKEYQLLQQAGNDLIEMTGSVVSGTAFHLLGKGFPVKVVIHKAIKGNPRVELLGRVDHVSLPPSSFAVPPNYEQEKIETGL